MDASDPRDPGRRTPGGSSLVVHPEVARLRRERLSGSALGLGRILLADPAPGPWKHLGDWLGSRNLWDVRVAARGQAPALFGGTALCIGVDEHEDDRFQFPRIVDPSLGWGPARSAQAASECLAAQGMRARVLTGATATQEGILHALRGLMATHDPDTPFLLWLSGLALGHGARTRFLPWDTDGSHPLGKALDMAHLHALLRATPHWGMVLDVAWPHGESSAERPGLIQRLRPLSELPLDGDDPGDGAPRVRTALLVAMSEAGHPDVPEFPGAGAEMDALGDILRSDLRFDVVRVLENPTEDAVLAAAGDLAAQAGPGGLFTFGFLGCGMQDLAARQSFLVCQGGDPGDLRGMAGLLPIHRLLLRTVSAGRRVLVLDFREGLLGRIGAAPMDQVETPYLGALAGAPSGAFQGIGALVVRGARGDFGACLRQALARLREGGAFSPELAEDLTSACAELEVPPTLAFVGWQIPSFAWAPRAPETWRAPIRVGLTPHSDFGLLQAALDAAPPGAVLHLAPGHYRESLVIQKPVTLVGLGTPAGAYLFTGEGDGICVESEGVCFRNLILVQEGECIRHSPAYHAAIRVTGGTLFLEQCEIHACRQAALVVNGVTSLAVLARCRLSGALEAGVKVEEGARVLLDGCELGDFGACAVELSCLAAAHLKGVRIWGRRMTGISVGRDSQVEVEGGLILASEDCGVVVVGKGEAFLQGCRFGDSARIGVLLRDCARALVRGCDFSIRVGHRPWHSESGARGQFQDNRIARG